MTKILSPASVVTRAEFDVGIDGYASGSEYFSEGSFVLHVRIG